ncbi:MAG: hypothetical protein WD276_00190 [Actinomycetota bacterium]
MKKLLISGGLAVAILLIAPAQTAFANFDQPDAFIKRIGSPHDSYHGKGITNDTGDNQVAKARFMVGDFGIFKVRVKNEGKLKDFYYVQGCEGTGKFNVKYADPDGDNISSDVKDGTYSTLTKDPDEASNVMFVGIKAKSSANPGDRRICKIEFDSDGSPGTMDVVRAVGKVIH